MASRNETVEHPLDHFDGVDGVQLFELIDPKAMNLSDEKQETT
jgi:hypothetical protein